VVFNILKTYIHDSITLSASLLSLKEIFTRALPKNDVVEIELNPKDLQAGMVIIPSLTHQKAVFLYGSRNEVFGTLNFKPL
jgi:hypothetical protein